MEVHKRKTLVRLILPLFLGTVLLAACSPAGQTTQESPTAVQEAQPNQANPTAQEPATQAAGSEQTPAAGDSQNGGYQLGFEPGDPNLKASDPTQESLTAGVPQFIDFFAFW